MQAKPTYYDGYHFRSKLEARWAVFFNFLKVPYVYEPEAFLCADGSQYTPDFYLPESYLRSSKGLYLEIKPMGFSDYPNHDGESGYLKRIASAFGENANLCLFVGDPMDNVCEDGYPGIQENQQLCPDWDNYMMLFLCESCGLLKAEFSEGNYMYCPKCDGKRDIDRIMDAAIFARQTRFAYLTQ